MQAKLIKIDRNGSKHYEGMVVCDRCGGSGIYAYCVCNGVVVPTIVDNGVCHKCNGAGKVLGKWIERTPEYQAKLDAKRQAKQDAEQAKRDAEQAKRDAEQAKRDAERKATEEAEEAKRLAEEARIKAQKAISQYVGNVGDKVELKVTYVRTCHWEQPSFRGFGTDTMYAHIFKDADGNVFVWKTGKGIGWETEKGWYVPNYGEPINVKATIKEHKEYDCEKQTVLTRCKVNLAF